MSEQLPPRFKKGARTWLRARLRTNLAFSFNHGSESAISGERLGLPDHFFCLRTQLLAVLGCFASLSMAQTNQPEGARWLSKAEVAAPFTAPESRPAWELKRQQVRAELWELLGRLPPRPQVPKVET